MYQIGAKCMNYHTKAALLLGYNPYKFRIIDRYIPTRKFLCTRNIIGSPLCEKCSQPEELQHFFFECASLRAFWTDILTQVKNIFHLPNEFVKVDTVLFGYVKASAVVNTIILLGKQYILNCKLGYRPTEVNKEQFLHQIMFQYGADKMIANQNNQIEKCNRKWDKIIDCNGNIKIR